MTPRLVSHDRLWMTAVQALVAGLVWIYLEHALRGGTETVAAWWDLVALCAIGVVVAGLGIQARVSFRGEILVAREFSSLVCIAVFFLPAALLVVYFVAFTLSVAVATVSWLVWCILVLLAVLLQIAIYAIVVLGLVGGGMVGGQGDSGLAVLLGGTIGLALSLIVVWVGTMAVGSSFASAFDFTVVNFTVSHRSWIPSFTVFLDALRQSLSGVSHGRIMSLVLSVSVGFLGGLAAALAARFFRQELMQNATIYPFLPLAKAPEPDDMPVVKEHALLPAVVYLFAAWLVLSAVLVFP